MPSTTTATASYLFRNGLQSIMGFLTIAELHSSIAVSRHWMQAGIAPDMPSINTTFNQSTQYRIYNIPRLLQRSRLAHLHIGTLSGLYVTLEDMPCLSKMTRIHTLSVGMLSSGSDVMVQVMMDFIRLLPRLRSIQIGSLDGSRDYLYALLNNLLAVPRIDTFSFACLGDARACMDALRSAPHLTAVNIPGANTHLYEEFLPTLFQPQALVGCQYFSCNDEYFDMGLCEELCKLPSLTRLKASLSSIHFTEDDFSPFSRMPMLSRLDLTCMHGAYFVPLGHVRANPIHFTGRFLLSLHPNAATLLTHLTLFALELDSPSLHKMLSHFGGLKHLAIERMHELTSLGFLPPTLVLESLAIRACVMLVQNRQQMIKERPALARMRSFIVEPLFD